MDGDVSPCVYTNVPTLAGNYYIRGEAHKIQSMFLWECQRFFFTRNLAARGLSPLPPLLEERKISPILPQLFEIEINFIGANIWIF